MFISLALSINENVIELHNNKDVKLFCQDLIDVALESCRYISQSKRHYLVLEVVIVNSKGHLLFITFFDLYPMISIS